MRLNRLIIIILAFAAAVSCKEVPQAPTAGKRIGEIYVTAAPGSRSVLVKLDGVWRVRPVSDWIHTDVNGREGEGAFTFTYDSNESDFINFRPVRRGAIVIQSLSTMVADTLCIIQQGIPDGKQYESLPQDSYIEFPEDQISSVTVLWANVQGAASAESWISSVGADINCIISDSGLEITLKDGSKADETGTMMKPKAVFAKVGRLNLALSDFGSEPESEDTYYNNVVDLLTASYDKPDAEQDWLVGGSFYYLSVMEAGYGTTPSWYPANPAAPEFAADRYVQGANLTDCVWMTGRDFTPTWTSGGKSWRADYVYASNSVWNAVTKVSVMDNVPSGASHKAVLINIKF